MFRYKLTLEYHGGAFSGWQKTPGQPSVQQALEDAIFSFCGERPQVVGAGRTDAGVHASGQVAHADFSREHAPFTIINALNHYLLHSPGGVCGRDITVLQAEAVPEAFHARFSAKARHYLYRILCRRAPPVLDAPFVWHVPEPLDAEAMQAAATLLVGHHDFTSFRDTRCQAKSPLKTLDRLDVSRQGEEIHIRASGRSFLHHQVRIMAGSLHWVGTGRWSREDLKAALDARDRTKGGPTAPAQGLCLLRVDYPEK